MAFYLLFCELAFSGDFTGWEHCGEELSNLGRREVIIITSRLFPSLPLSARECTPTFTFFSGNLLTRKQATCFFCGF